MLPLTFYKAVADLTRLKALLLIMKEGELCVCELVAALNESQPKISRHLAQLRKEGLVTDHKVGVWVYYQLHPALPKWAHQSLAMVLHDCPDYITPEYELLLAMGDRPARQTSCCTTSK